MRGGRGGGELYLGQLGRLHARVVRVEGRWVRRVRGSAAARVRLGVAVRRARAGAAAARVRGRDAEPLAAHRAAHALLVALLRALRPLRPEGGGTPRERTMRERDGVRLLPVSGQLARRMVAYFTIPGPSRGRADDVRWHSR